MFTENDNINDHIDVASASLADRARPQVANHVRTVQVQTLDALLRIEETMNAILNGLRHFAQQQDKNLAPPVRQPLPDAAKEAPKVAPRSRR